MDTGSYVRGDLAILEAGFAALEQAVLVHDNEGIIVACNPAAAKLAGRPVDEILGRGAGDYECAARFKDGTPVTPENSRLLRCIRTGEPERDVVVEIVDRSRNAPRWVVANYQPLIHEGEAQAWGAVASIVPVQDAAERTLADLASQLDAAPAPLLAIDPDGRVSFANRAARAIARESDDLQLAIDGNEPLAVFLGDDDATVAAAIDADRPVSLTRRFERPDGADLWLAIEVAHLRPGAGAMCSLRDVTEDREREEELSHQALHDSLTGLPNRRFTEEQLTLGLARARRQQGGVGVVFLDIDNFKAVNDELGHATGDEVLIELAERLSGCFRETDAVGRLSDRGTVVGRRGGDEFVVVLSDLPADCAELVANVMKRVESALAPPFRAGGHALEVSASLGAAVYPYDSQDPATLLELANAAMRSAKRRKRG